jgi:hypothetical protein
LVHADHRQAQSTGAVNRHDRQVAAEPREGVAGLAQRRNHHDAFYRLFC